MSHMLQRVVNGDMAPASFQRPYVWTKEDVLALCESVVQGFPLGGFLSWVPQSDEELGDVGRSRLGPIETKPMRPYRTSLLLDGQNRLATLAWMLRIENDSMPDNLVGIEKETWGSGESLVLDIKNHMFEWVPDAQANDGMRIPAWVACGISRETSRFMRLKWDQWDAAGFDGIDDAMRFHDKVTYSFREARITETILENATVDEARKAFRHICRVGVPMSAEDFDAAIGFVPPSASRRSAP